MRRLIQIVGRLYPRAWRERYGDEFAALLDDVNPGWRTLCNVFAGAVAMRLPTLSLRSILAISAVLACGAFVVELRLPNTYRSSGIFILQGPETKSARNGVVRNLMRQIESRESLANFIASENLYPRERSRMPMNEVVDLMRSNIRVTPDAAHDPDFGFRSSSSGPALARLEMEFFYSDPNIAGQVTQKLMIRLMEDYRRVAEAEDPVASCNLQIMTNADSSSQPFRDRRLIALIAASATGFLSLSWLLFVRWLMLCRTLRGGNASRDIVLRQI
jgi:hypothetical protein